MSGPYILSIDQGTTGSTALVIDLKDSPKIIGRSTVDFTQYYPDIGWVEHDLDEVWASVSKAIKLALDSATSKQNSFRTALISAIGITNQRETLCVYDRKTGKPLTKAIVWQCKRSRSITEQLKAEGLENEIKNKTGLVLDPYFSGSKISWLLKNRSDIAKKIADGTAVFGTIDTYLMARLSDCKTHATEASNASRTLLYNIHSGQWDSNLLKVFGLKNETSLPEVKDSAGLFGKTLNLDFLPDGIPITGVLGDQQAALAGQTCFTPGEAKCTYGTGAFLLVNQGEKPILSTSGLLTTVAWSLKGKRTFASEGSAFIAGAAIQFLRDQLKLIASAGETEDLAKGATAAPHVYFVPSLSGLGAPYWNPKAEGAFLGLTRGTTLAQCVRAALEGIAFEVADLTQAIAKDLGHPLSILRVDGGAAVNSLLLQAQADFSRLVVDRPKNLETTALGAGLFAALGAGIFKDLSEVRNARERDLLFTPESDHAGSDSITAKLNGWKRAVKAVEVFAGQE